ncbi:hypothetical protein UPYG_G00142790 [Umbra pygmaea]|uniref:IRF tryptophan pentad repeat domain-containing protein n=1 Tax=Umbra pygmaea TaxID=75934 RepID=A0ABD0X037_UMBPY
MAQSKPLLIPWLRKQISSGHYPGVSWTNQEQTEFCIPWKHGLRQDSSGVDVLIFKAWAEVSTGVAKGDPSIWKRNFRSALSAKKFTMIADNKNDAANPHKLYRWPDEAPSGGSQDSEADVYPDPGQDSHFLPLYAEPYIPVEPTSYLAVQGSSTSNQDVLRQCLEGLNITPPGQPPYMGEMNGAVGGHLLTNQLHLMADQQRMEQLRDTLSRSSADNHFNTDFRVLVYYRGVMVLNLLINNPAGFRLVYRPEQTQSPVMDPESGMSLISLPGAESLMDQTQAKLTQQILDGLGNGIEVGESGFLIYGRRMGASKAYWSFDKFDRTRMPQEVSKSRVPLYLTKDFIGGLCKFMDNNGGVCPPISLFFCLGEKWPDPENKPMEKKLITVEVVFTAMEMLKSLAVTQGASSLQSVELQLSMQESLQEMMELIESYQDMID